MNFFLFLLFITLTACSHIPQPQTITLTPLFSTAPFTAPLIAAPLLYQNQLITAASDGVISALNAETGAVLWQTRVPAADEQQILLKATPALVGNQLIVLYQLSKNGTVLSHSIVVLDLQKRQLNPQFPVLALAGEKIAADGRTRLVFEAKTATSHAALSYAAKAGTDGYIYAGLGNRMDTQPYHGWLFEIDLSAWRQGGQAISGVLLTTPEANCPVSTAHGTVEMICGGGIWTPAGLPIYATGEDFELFVPTGNGQLDLARRDYANTLMRLRQGLAFDAGCDALLCKNFNPHQPSEACLASCKNVFIPRLAQGNAPLKPASGECDDKSFSDCLARMDYDLGANAPVKITLRNGMSVLLQPSKDGGVYLLDAQQLGKQYDRLQIVEVCGTATTPCYAPTAGMMVTQAAITMIANDPVVVVPTFVVDDVHLAGLVALKIVLENNRPVLKHFWQVPAKDSADSQKTFRVHPSLPIIHSLTNDAEPIAWVVDSGTEHGTLYAVRVRDGKLLVKQALQGLGQQLSRPVFYGDTIYLASITLSPKRQARLEAYRCNY